jgi:NAD(P) transhydrogenase subunit alpha
MSETLEVSLFIFVLASFLGYAVITRVPGLLHTPLMSLTNALSAISIVGSLILAGGGETAFATILGTIAVFASTTNIVSGFLITDRMLKMFKRRDAPGRPSAAPPNRPSGATP